jgi:hypothetical protein
MGRVCDSPLRQAMQDALAGRVRPAREALEEIRKELGKEVGKVSRPILLGMFYGRRANVTARYY